MLCGTASITVLTMRSTPSDMLQEKCTDFSLTYLNFPTHIWQLSLNTDSLKLSIFNAKNKYNQAFNFLDMHGIFHVSSLLMYIVTNEGFKSQ